MLCQISFAVLVPGRRPRSRRTPPPRRGLGETSCYKRKVFRTSTGQRWRHCRCRRRRSTRKCPRPLWWRWILWANCWRRCRRRAEARFAAWDRSNKTFFAVRAHGDYFQIKLNWFWKIFFKYICNMIHLTSTFVKPNLSGVCLVYFGQKVKHCKNG